jgi:hypothetical protein
MSLNQKSVTTSAAFIMKRYAMGEARRKREAVLNGPCPCGSTKAGRFCCFNGKDWHKPAAVLGLKSLPPASKVEKCYMKELGSCVGPISAEHIISESVIRVLMADGDFSVSGLPWLAPGEEKLLAPKNLTTNCLCVKHNSVLHPLDDAAQYFFASLKSYLEHDDGSKHAVVSGHDIERWLLKTAKAAAISKNLARGRERLSGAFARDEVILDMLDSPDHWPDGVGLYGTMNTGDMAINHPRFQLQPLTNEQDEIEALALNMLGLSFVLLLAPPNMDRYPFLRGARYRPGRIMVSYPTSTSWLTMSWDDGRKHEPLTMQFVRPVP